jgi:predicted DNA-binding protein (MmcQ/YjbR family)
MNKRHWITITLSPTLPADLIEDLISDSYDLVIAALPSHARLSLGTEDR